MNGVIHISARKTIGVADRRRDVIRRPVGDASRPLPSGGVLQLWQGDSYSGQPLFWRGNTVATPFQQHVGMSCFQRQKASLLAEGTQCFLLLRCDGSLAIFG